jgi:hypothetical protein
MYKVEYAMGDAFNYKSMEFHNLLSACDVEYSGDEFDSDFEVSKEEWRKAIDKLKDLHDLDDDKREEITGAIEDLASTTDEVIHMMEYYLEHGDPDIDYLHLSYF